MCWRASFLVLSVLSEFYEQVVSSWDSLVLSVHTAGSVFFCIRPGQGPPPSLRPIASPALRKWSISSLVARTWWCVDVHVCRELNILYVHWRQHLPQGWSGSSVPTPTMDTCLFASSFGPSSHPTASASIEHIPARVSGQLRCWGTSGCGQAAVICLTSDYIQECQLWRDTTGSNNIGCHVGDPSSPHAGKQVATLDNCHLTAWAERPCWSLHHLIWFCIMNQR